MALKHILVADDDPALVSLLHDYLSMHSFRVSGASNSYQFSQIAASQHCDLFIIDLTLGNEDGTDLVRKAASQHDVPIIIVSGSRLDETDKVIGLELGATCFMDKPFSLRELLARVRVALRAQQARSEIWNDCDFSFEGWRLVTKAKHLYRPDGTLLKLTRSELSLLTAFLGSPGQILSREQLLTNTKLYDEEVSDRSIDILILRLRRKMEVNPAHPRLIVTERGQGYRFGAMVENGVRQ